MEGNRLKAYEWNDESAYGMKGMWVQTWAVFCEKVPNVLSPAPALIPKNSKKSVSYQKKGGRGPARPSFICYDNDSGQ